MRRTASLLLTLSVALAACSESPTRPGPEQQAPAQSVVGAAPVYLVTFRDGVDVPSTTAAMAREFGFAVRFMRRHAAPGFSAVLPRPLATRIAQDPRVAIVEEDGPVTLVLPRVEARPTPPSAAQATPWGITRIGGAGDGTGRTAWIIDTGIDLAHADLNTSKDCHVSFVTRGKYSPADGNGHGTHVAGTVAAKNNGIDVVGVAANAWVCSVRVLDNSGSGTWEWVVNGVDHVAANGASGHVANLSLGGSGTQATLEKAVADAAKKGVRMVLAAGNNGSHAGNFTPARVNDTNIYTVSAIASNDCMPSWSNWGNPPVDYAAPGVGVLSTKKGGGTTSMSGTSMAAPHVAGILLLGSIRSDGTAKCDPDGNPDPIAHR